VTVRLGRGINGGMEESERNPEVEALQQALDTFRESPLELPPEEILGELRSLIDQTSTFDKEVISFLGIPGAGKSKLIEKVSRLLNAPVFHVRELVRIKPEIKKSEEKFYRNGELLPGIEDEFLNLVFKSKHENILVDGFPRSLFQALELYRRAKKAGRSVTIVEIQLQSGREVFQSYHRQLNRAAHRERKGLLFGSALETEEERIMKKIQRALDLDLYVIEVLRHAGAEILQVDAKDGPSKMLKQFKALTGIEDTQSED